MCRDWSQLSIDGTTLAQALKCWEDGGSEQNHYDKASQLSYFEMADRFITGLVLALSSPYCCIEYVVKVKVKVIPCVCADTARAGKGRGKNPSVMTHSIPNLPDVKRQQPIEINVTTRTPIPIGQVNLKT